MKLNNDVLMILNRFKVNNYQAYVVGGAVRDFFMNKLPEDFDITTNALPQEIITIFSDYNLVLTGLKHGTIGVIIKKKVYEITTFRKDENYSDHRHPNNVEFVDNLKIDLSRRDFTINAMAYDIKLYDYYNGINDIKNKIIRTVGNPERRFNEDALRIIRAIRFSSTLGFIVEEVTKKAIFDYKNLLSYLPIERINIEFFKIVCTNDFYKCFEEYFLVFVEFMPDLFSIIKNNQFINVIKALRYSKNDLDLRLSILYKNVYLNTTEESSNEVFISVLKKYHYSKKMINSVLKINEIADKNLENNKKYLRKLLSLYDFDLVIKGVELKRMFTSSIKDEKKGYYECIINLINEIKDDYCNLKNLSINGNDLLQLGVVGKEIRKYLSEIINLVNDEKIGNNKEEIIKYLQTNNFILEKEHLL